jgi:hypothetical protein
VEVFLPASTRGHFVRCFSVVSNGMDIVSRELGMIGQKWLWPLGFWVPTDELSGDGTEKIANW